MKMRACPRRNFGLTSAHLLGSSVGPHGPMGPHGPTDLSCTTRALRTWSHFAGYLYLSLRCSHSLKPFIVHFPFKHSRQPTRQSTRPPSNSSHNNNTTATATTAAALLLLLASCLSCSFVSGSPSTLPILLSLLSLPLESILLLHPVYHSFIEG